MSFCRPNDNSVVRLIRPEVHILHKSRSVFRLCGYTGLILAILLVLILITHPGLSLWVMAGIVLAAAFTFFALAMVTKIITGEESLIYYHHEIAIIGVTAVLLWLLRRPILPYLDATILGIGIFLACGRVGCLMVGCCHGRPHRWGVCYREEHAAAGFAPYFVGVRLFPIQLVESLWVFVTVLVGSALVLTDHLPGEALAWYVITYGVGRFCFEFARGDPDRPYFWGFSEAQWTSLLLMCVVVWAELASVLPFHLWHAGATASLGLTMLAVFFIRRFQKMDRYNILHPRHVREVAEAVEMLSNLTPQGTDISEDTPIPTNIPIGWTSLSIQISTGKIKSAVGVIDHYTLSSPNGIMNEENVKIFSNLILRLRHPSGSSEVIKGNRGVFHVLVYP